VPVLDARIEARVRRELDEGLVGEIERALARADLSREAAQVIGAREVAAMRAGALAPGDLPGALAARTRRLARRQLSWLRRMPGAVPLDLGGRASAAGAAHLLRRWRESGR
jgi:tRNA dimethylallyltransferase